MSTALDRYAKSRELAAQLAQEYRLRSRQQAVLASILLYRGWISGTGWKWGSDSETDSVLRTLAKKGLVEIIVERDGNGYGQFQPVEAIRL